MHDAKKTEELHHLTQKFGTKMAYLVFYLKHLLIDSPESRVIVFSQVSCSCSLTVLTTTAAAAAAAAAAGSGSSLCVTGDQTVM